MREMLRKKSSDMFRAGFEERVMSRIRAVGEDSFSTGLFLIFRPVAIAALALIIILASFNMAANDDLSIQGIFAQSEVAPQEAFNPLVDLVQE
jgi:hypothetical protein